MPTIDRRPIDCRVSRHTGRGEKRKPANWRGVLVVVALPLWLLACMPPAAAPEADAPDTPAPVAEAVPAPVVLAPSMAPTSLAPVSLAPASMAPASMAPASMAPTTIESAPMPAAPAPPALSEPPAQAAVAAPQSPPPCPAGSFSMWSEPDAAGSAVLICRSLRAGR